MLTEGVYDPVEISNKKEFGLLKRKVEIKVHRFILTK